MTYQVTDLLTSPNTDDNPGSQLDLLAQQIKDEVMPGVLHKQGAKLAVMREKSSVVVAANHLVHEAVATYLKKARGRELDAAEK